MFLSFLFAMETIRISYFNSLQTIHPDFKNSACYPVFIRSQETGPSQSLFSRDYLDEDIPLLLRSVKLSTSVSNSVSTSISLGPRLNNMTNGNNSLIDVASHLSPNRGSRAIYSSRGKL